MTPQSASGLSTPGIPSALRREEASRTGRAHPNLSAQSAVTPAPGFPVRPLRPSKLDPIRPRPPRPPRPPRSASPPRLFRSSPRPLQSTPIRPVYCSPPRPGFRSPLRPPQSALVRPVVKPRPGFRSPLRPQQSARPPRPASVLRPPVRQSAPSIEGRH